MAEAHDDVAQVFHGRLLLRVPLGPLREVVRRAVDVDDQVVLRVEKVSCPRLEPSDSPGTSNSPITHRRMRRNLEWFLRWLRP